MKRKIWLLIASSILSYLLVGCSEPDPTFSSYLRGDWKLVEAKCGVSTLDISNEKEVLKMYSQSMDKESTVGSCSQITEYDMEFPEQHKVKLTNQNCDNPCSAAALSTASCNTDAGVVYKFFVYNDDLTLIDEDTGCTYSYKLN